MYFTFSYDPALLNGCNGARKRPHPNWEEGDEDDEDFALSPPPIFRSKSEEDLPQIPREAYIKWGKVDHEDFASSPPPAVGAAKCEEDLPPIPRKLCVIWGTGEIGKIAAANKLVAKVNEKLGWNTYLKDRTEWWDTYQGEEVVILNDFEGESSHGIPFAQFTQMCDGTLLHHKVSGGGRVESKLKLIVIISKQSSLHYYPSSIKTGGSDSNLLYYSHLFRHKFNFGGDCMILTASERSQQTYMVDLMLNFIFDPNYKPATPRRSYWQS